MTREAEWPENVAKNQHAQMTSPPPPPYPKAWLKDLTHKEVQTLRRDLHAFEQAGLDPKILDYGWRELPPHVVALFDKAREDESISEEELRDREWVLKTYLGIASLEDVADHWATNEAFRAAWGSRSKAVALHVISDRQSRRRQGVPEKAQPLTADEWSVITEAEPALIDVGITTFDLILRKIVRKKSWTDLGVERQQHDRARHACRHLEENGTWASLGSKIDALALPKHRRRELATVCRVGARHG